MSAGSGWAAELLAAVRALAAGRAGRVSFTAAAGAVGELGREFNQLAEELEQAGNGLTREQAHGLRNRLAGVLAAVHVLRESAANPVERAVLAEVVAVARHLDTRLRSR